jgi:predicted alpha/beta superfamily hydrolase
MKRALLLAGFLICILYSLKAQDEYVANTNNRSDLQGTTITPVITERTVWSAFVNDYFKLYISFPENYDYLRTEKYPVVYFLDGDGGSFHTIIAEYMQQGVIPDVITIGIGYPGASQRNRDYTYGYINFYHFLKDELIPRIEEDYNTDPQKRTLFGHSYGGIFALMTMYQYTDFEDVLFHNLIAASPSIWWPDGQLAYNLESTLYSQTHILPVNLYMTVGSLEGSMVTDMERMQQVLENRNYGYFNLYALVNQGKDHSTNKEITFRDGIRWILNQDIPLPFQTDGTAKVLSQSRINVYPNPVKEILRINSDQLRQEGCRIELINSSGKTFFQANTNTPEMQLDVSKYPKGFYILKITGKELLYTNKIVVN